jgi:hypothetical protein
MGFRNLFRFGPTREDRRDKYLAQQDWYIDPAAGNDNNSGASGSPIQTWNELRARLDKGTLRQLLRVFLLGDLAEDIIVDWQAEDEVSKGAYTLVIGVRTNVLAAHTVATNVDYDPVTGTLGYFTDAAVADWTAYKDDLFEIVGGARDTCVGHVIGAVAGNVDRCRFQPMYSFATGQAIYQPQAGDTFRTYHVTKITGQVQQLARGVLQFMRCEIDESGTPAKSAIENCDGGTFFATGCIVRGGFCTQRGGYWQFAGCHVAMSAAGVNVMDGAMFDNWGNWWEGSAPQMLPGSLTDVQGHCVVTGTSQTALLGGTERVLTPFWVCHLASTGTAYYVGLGGTLDATQQQLWGSVTGAAKAIFCEKDGKVFYDPNYPIAITGATHQYQIGNTTYDDATIPASVYPDGCVQRMHDFWNNVSANCTVQGPGNGMKLTGGGGAWGDGAGTVDGIAAGADGYLFFQATPAWSDKSCGLTDNPASHAFGQMDFGIYIDSGTNKAQVHEAGVAKGVKEAFAVTDTFKIVIGDAHTTVKYYHNGVLMYESLAAPAAAAYYGHAYIFSLNSIINNARMIPA